MDEKVAILIALMKHSSNTYMQFTLAAGDDLCGTTLLVAIHEPCPATGKQLKSVISARQ